MLGKAVTDFSLASTDGTTFTLSARRGEKLVLYFYPKDDPPGCTAEGADFRDLHAQFRRAGARVFGVSRDCLSSHARVQGKKRVPLGRVARALQGKDAVPVRAARGPR